MIYTYSFNVTEQDSDKFWGKAQLTLEETCTAECSIYRVLVQFPDGITRFLVMEPACETGQVLSVVEKILRGERVKVTSLDEWNSLCMAVFKDLITEKRKSLNIQLNALKTSNSKLWEAWKDGRSRYPEKEGKQNGTN